MEAQNNQGFKWFVCHDGSQTSADAFKEVRWSLMDDKKDSIVVAHVWNKEKNEYLEEKMKEVYIKQWADTECIALGERYTYWSKEMITGDDANGTAKELL